MTAAIERRTGTRPESLRPIPALVVDVPRGVSLEGIRGIRYVEPLVTRRLAFTPSDPLVSKQWYLGYSGFYSSWPTLPSFEPIPVAVIDSGVDGTHPDLARTDPRRGELRRRQRAHRHARARNLRRGAHRRGRRQRRRHRGARAVRAAPRREGGHEVARDPGGSGGEGDPLGGRQRCARDQHEPRRDPRPARSRAGYVLTARGRRRRLRGHERRRRRRSGRKLRPGACEPVEVRELSGGAPSRPRRQRDRPTRAASRRSRTATGSTTTSRLPGSGSSRSSRAR